MAYPGFPFPTSVRESFIGHKVVLDYLESFAQHNQLHQYIKVCLCLIDVPLNILEKYMHITLCDVRDTYIVLWGSRQVITKSKYLI